MLGFSQRFQVICSISAFLMAVGIVFGAARAAIDFDRLQASFTQRWGSAPLRKFGAWRELVESRAGGSEMEQLKTINNFFNRQIEFGDDAVIWKQADYWATPLETLGRGAGDCEDFVIAKYYTLQMVGISADKLRLVYVRARTGGADSGASQAHMVLAYFAQPGAEPLLLDNLIGDIRFASGRPDLSPVFSFNHQGIFSADAGQSTAPAVGNGRLSRWEDLLRRARVEGFE